MAPTNIDAEERDREIDNAGQLKILSVIITSILGEKNASDIDALLAQVNSRLDENKIHLKIDAGVETLQELILSQAADSRQDFSAKLDDWVKSYNQLEAETTTGLAQKDGRHGPNIARSLMSASGDPATVWGDDVDMQLVLKDVIANTADKEFVFASNQTYILKPTPIAAAEVEKEFTNPVANLKNQIQPVVDKCRNETKVRLLIPVSSDQIHWHLFVIGISYGRITGAALLDSAKSKVLQKQPAYHNAQVVVSELNHDGKIKVKPVSTGRHEVDYTSMDYVVQTALNGLNMEARKNEENNEIRWAGNSHDLRAAIIGKIAQATPAIQEMIKKFGLFAKREKEVDVARIGALLARNPGTNK
ncbi:MAG TPA: hypothetical protein VL360_07860 [Gammaproteobacteria bacterium]|jgi:hypothetical protein|nr:hypothetical protein [Gammaproteobacteria bacterium]